MKTNLIYTGLTALFCAMFMVSPAQLNEWSWEDAMQGTNAFTYYGPEGSTPGGRSGATTWTDTSGRFWLFGGAGFTIGTGTGYLNDLWVFDPATEIWQWVSGNSTLNSYGVYNSAGSEVVQNLPGGRSNPASWIDTNGNLWLFGGYGYAASSGPDHLNDLWKFSPSTMMWTFVKGSTGNNQSGVYGTMGTPNAANYPGARSRPIGWADDDNNLWLYGGYATATGANCFSDLWRYNIATNVWTWMKGTSSTGQTSVYGTQGTAAATNRPGGRLASVAMTDTDGNFWMFGGEGYGTSGTLGFLNDLWKYDPATNNWTWMKGSTGISQSGIYGTQGTEASTNVPGARYHQIGWADTSGNIWIHGGSAWISGGTGYSNDLWRYSITTNNWTWMKGSNNVSQYGIYGNIGVANGANAPGARVNHVAWRALDGSLWLFGGGGYHTFGGTDQLNDIWKYNPATNQWTWMKGAKIGNREGIYGMKSGTATSPGARQGAAQWTDSNGDLWLFGGLGYGEKGTTGSTGTGYLSDLWKYSVSMGIWTKIRGTNTFNQFGVYGTQGVPSPSNTPGARYFAVTWVDTLGNFWLFGGFGMSATSNGSLNDIWMYNPASDEWTWMKGSQYVNQNGSYGTQGTASATNGPGGRYGAVSWSDGIGNLWLFGGQGYAASCGGYLNDLWKYDISTNMWTWVKGSSGCNSYGTYGTQGTSGASNTPGARQYSSTWQDANGQLWLFGGYGYSSGNTGHMNDLWKYNPATNGWTWMKGSAGALQYGTYGTQGTAASGNNPGTRYAHETWTDTSGMMWLFGGYGFASATEGYLNDLWRYNPTTNQWTWMKGVNTQNNSGTYGVLGEPDAANKPGARYLPSAWAGHNGQLWLFGGWGYGFNGAVTGALNDLWSYDIATNNWTWQSGGFNIDAQGVASVDSPRPGGRRGQVVWKDTAGMIWMFGGQGYAASATGGPAYLSDLWKYNPSTKEWTFMKGGTYVNELAEYGTMGAANAFNRPGSRTAAVGWTDNNGMLWLYGGNGYAASGGTGNLNDLWRYNTSTNEWTWIKGSDFTGSASGYGTMGTAAASNTPGGRYGSAVWKTSDNTLWLYGGYGHANSSSVGYLGDLWKYNISTNQWTWVKGSNGYNVGGTFGTMGTAASTNNPPATYDPATWTDADNNLWMFGGSNGGWHNAMWKYNPTSNQWTWVKGSTSLNVVGTYGTQGTPTASTTPGSRVNTYSWTDLVGNMWLFGGSGYSASASGWLNDLWRYSPTTNQWAWMKGSNTPSQGGVYGAQGTSSQANTPGSRYTGSVWTDDEYGLWLFGGEGYVTNSSYGYLNDVWKYTWHVCETQAAIDTAQNVLCFGANSGSISIEVTNATGTLTYEWNNGDTTSTAPNLSAGTYTVSVTDALGCSATVSASITQPASAVAVSIGSVTNVLCFGNSTGQATANGTGGTGSKTYAWSGGGTSATKTNMSVGTYTVTATDANGCTATSSVTITQPSSAVSVSIGSVTNVLCFGNSTGQATATGTGGTGSKTYAWSGGGTSATKTNLAAGTYTVTATDANGCTATSSLTITQPSSAVSVSIGSVTNVLCNGASTGSATATGTGGTGSKTYVWSGGGTSATKTNMSAGTYTVTATDANGCTATASVTITQPSSAVSVSIGSVTNVLCFGNSTGSATASGSGGTGTSTFAWSNSTTTAANSSLTAGTYTVTATDANGCTATASVTITQPASAVSVSIGSVTNVLCFGNSTGSATASGTGGTGTITYAWSNSTTTAAVSSLAAGTYTVTATDANGCTATDEITITEPASAVSVTATATDALCFGDANGEATATGTGGTGAMAYAWSNGGTSATIGSLTAGIYSVTATDANGCTATAQTTIGEPTLLEGTTNATAETCDGDSNGTITATPSGGTAPYTYSWSDGQTATTATDLAPGVYDLTITDDHGCTLVLTDTIFPGNPLPQPDLGADTLFTTSVVYTLDPGVFDSYEWSDGSTNSTLDVSASGNYWVNVYDTDGCTGADSINVTIWPTGIAEQSAGTISVFPNPTLGQLTIKSSINFDRNAQFQLLSAQGQLVMVINAADQTDTVKVNLESLAKGTYTLRVSSSTMVKTFSVVVM